VIGNKEEGKKRKKILGICMKNLVIINFYSKTCVAKEYISIIC